jgi:hypothetical protein
MAEVNTESSDTIKTSSGLESIVSVLLFCFL